MTGTVTVRRATEADIPTLAYHRAAMFRDMGALRENLFQPLVEATLAYLPEAMQTGEYISWVAIDATGAIVGGAGLQLRRMLPRPDDDAGDLIDGPQALVLSVYTEPAWRRRGVARLLMQELLHWTRDHGVKSVVLHAAPEARRLYEQLGFVATNEMRLADCRPPSPLGRFMTDIDAGLANTRSAVDALIAAAEASGPAWLKPRAPGKWSPSQIVEHVARSLEESAKVAAGAPSKFPTFPVVVRPLVRTLFFNRVLRKQAFPKAKTSRAMNPEAGPETPAAGRARLENAFLMFDRDCRVAAQRSDTIATTLFGPVSVVDFVRFQELHTRHHLRQMPA